MAALMLMAGFNLCSEEDRCNEEQTNLVSKSNDAPEEKDRQCSPFCQCSRCPFSILLPANVINNPIIALSVNRFKYQPVSVPQPITPAIWQPPKAIL